MNIPQLFTISLHLIIFTLNKVYSQQQSQKGAVIIRTDRIAVDSTEYFSDDPTAVLGLSKEHAAQVKKEQIIEGRTFSHIDSAIGRTFHHTHHTHHTHGKQTQNTEIRYLNNWYNGVNVLRRDGTDLHQWWNPGSPVKVLIHGFTPKTFEKDPLKKIAGQNIFKIADSYKGKDSKLNVLTVDWTAFSTFHLLKYYEAVASVPTVGADVAEFLNRLKNKGLINDWKDVHIIGYSLGAHIAGIAANKLQSLSGGGKVGRITGLDPAGPLYDDGSGNFVVGLDQALDSSDAEFVDIMHCNGQQVRKRKKHPGLEAMGSTVVAGHADFYPDGGEVQKVCSHHENKKGCSHYACTKIFAKTINENLLSCPCEDYERFVRGACPCTMNLFGIYLGDAAQIRHAKGKYYLHMGYWE